MLIYPPILIQHKPQKTAGNLEGESEGQNGYGFTRENVLFSVPDERRCTSLDRGLGSEKVDD